MTKKLAKEMAVKCLEKLNIYKPYINGFKSKEQKVCFFENYGGFYDYQEKEIIEKRQKLEKKYNITVYAITHEFTDFGECFDFMFVDNTEDCSLEYYVDGDSGSYYVYSYVWNKTYEDCSEFGTIVVNSLGGGVMRVG